MKRTAWAAALMATTMVTPAAAQTFARTTSADWNVFEGNSGDDCSIHREFEGTGATELFITYKPDNRGFIAVVNSAWSIRERETFTLFIRVGNVEKMGDATGVRLSYKGGFYIGIPDASFLDVIANGSNIEFFRQNGEEWTLIDNLRLDGTREAARLLRQCLRTVGTRLARIEADRRRLQHIPTDPFATPTPPTPTPTPPSMAPVSVPVPLPTSSDETAVRNPNPFGSQPAQLPGTQPHPSQPVTAPAPRP